MNQLIAITVVFAISVVAPSMAQAPAGDAKTPRQVVEDFLAMETRGGRLTPEGWAKADEFFAHPVPVPHEKRVVVISKHYSVYETSVNGDRAEVYNDYEDLGRIDSELRYTAASPGLLKTTATYHLVRTHPSDSSSEWKITEPATTLWLNTEAAATYVAESRDKTSSPAFKKNADRTLVILRRHQ